MRVQKQCRIILSLLMGLILFAFCLPVCAFAEPAELSDGDEKGISLSTTVPPSIISGAGGTYEKGGTDGLIFKTDDTKDNLLRVLVDGKVVSPKNYTVSGEPLTVTLHTGYLDTLSVGGHTIEIVTVNGTARARFTIKEFVGISETDTPLGIPKTGDGSNTELWIMLMTVSSALIVSLLLAKRMYRKERRKAPAK